MTMPAGRPMQMRLKGFVSTLLGNSHQKRGFQLDLLGLLLCLLFTEVYSETRTLRMFQIAIILYLSLV